MTPKATNKLNSYGVYENRKSFKELQVGEFSIDLWYNKNLYGRIDNRNNSIFIKEDKLKIINKKFYLLNFAADAFNDFSKFYTQKTGLNLEIKEAWTGSNTSYHNYMIALYDGLKIYIQQNKKVINNFNDFLIFLKEYLLIIIDYYPITKSKFIQSKFCSPNVSGLIVDLKKENHSVDQNKYENYSQNDDFLLLEKIANQYGFVVDHNAPWRLIADLESFSIKPYLQKYNILNTEDFFTAYCEKQYINDNELLKSYISLFYYSLIGKKSEITVIDDFYVLVLVLERGIPITDNKYQYLLNNYTFLKKTLDKVKSEAYINKALDDLIES